MAHFGSRFLFLCVVLVLCAGLFAAEAKAAAFAGRGPGPRPGDHAPSFELTALGFPAPLSLDALRRDQPVALVFGSFT